MNERKVAVVGTGNVATHLASGFLGKGIDVHMVNSRSLEGIQSDTGIVLISVSDSVISEVAFRVHEVLPSFKGVVAHTAGSVQADILSTWFENFGVFYPLQTFSKEIPIKNYNEIPIFIEGNNLETEVTLHKLAEKFSDMIFKLSSEKREKLHLASVFACNFVNAMYSVAEELVAGIDIPFDALRPLIAATAEKAINNSPEVCQTGPARRGDFEVLKKHIDLLDENRDLKEIYREISNRIKLKYEQN